MDSSYVAPEVWLGTREFSPAVDLALGAIQGDGCRRDALRRRTSRHYRCAINGRWINLQQLRLHAPSSPKWSQDCSSQAGGAHQPPATSRTRWRSSLPCIQGRGTFAVYAPRGGLFDPEMTLDNATARTASTGDRDWRRLRPGVGEDIDLTVASLSLNSLVHGQGDRPAVR